MNEADLRKQKARAYVRKHRYGITEEEYDALLVAQGYACAVCKIEFSAKAKPNVDHDRNCCEGTKSCGTCVRGLLCSHCLILASLVETRFKYVNDMFAYLYEHLVNGRRK